MNATPLLAAALLLTAPVSLLAVPTADAFGWCADAVPGKECWSHWACIGMSRDYTTHREWCQYGVPDLCHDGCIRDPCDWLCWTGPPLP